MASESRRPSLSVLPAPGQIEDTPEMFGPNKEDPMDAAFREYNCFGIAEHTDQYKLAEKDCQAMKAHPLVSERFTARIAAPARRPHPHNALELACYPIV